MAEFLLELFSEEIPANLQSTARINLLESFNIKVSLLLGNQKNSEKISIREDIKLGNINIVVGTHSLIQKEILFKNLALTIIDEQHKFGVHQRMHLFSKGKSNEIYPHQLILTATPIPRTLAMTMYGHLDYSIIDEMPLGRKKIITVAKPEEKRKRETKEYQSSCGASNFNPCVFRVWSCQRAGISCVDPIPNDLCTLFLCACLQEERGNDGEGNI